MSYIKWDDVEEVCLDECPVAGRPTSISECEGCNFKCVGYNIYHALKQRRVEDRFRSLAEHVLEDVGYAMSLTDDDIAQMKKPSDVTLDEFLKEQG